MCSIFARVPAIAAVLCSCVTAAEAGAEIWEFESRPGVIEAKMFSNLSRGTKNALEYDQAARNVACMAHTIAKSGIQVDDLKSVGFFVIAPAALD
jgi:PIN domain nuclease of toxin-antitoxin system